MVILNVQNIGLELALTLIPTSRSEQEQHQEMQPRLQLAFDSLFNLCQA